MESCKQVMVIEATFTRGRGVNDRDPVRRVTQWWTLEGELIAERDPVEPHYMRPAEDAVGLSEQSA